MFKHQYIIFSILILLVSPLAKAQNEPPLKQLVEIIMLESRSLNAELYFREYNGNYTPVKIAQGTRGVKNLQVLDDQFILNRKTHNEAGDVIYVPTMTIDIPEEERVTILFYGDKSGAIKSYVIDDSIEQHPGGTARVINLTSDQVACIVGNESTRLSPLQSFVSKNLFQDSNRFEFGFSVNSADRGRKESDLQRYKLRTNDSRFLALIAYSEFQSAGPNPGEVDIKRIPVTFRLYDRVPTKPLNPVN